MKKEIILVFTIVVNIVASCSTYNNSIDKMDEELEEIIGVTEVEVEDGDFVYRLVTEKSEYEEYGDVTIYAELEYTGENDTVTIFHAASPFYFDITELTRNFTIYHNMESSLLSTILHKGEPYREIYSRSGSYTDQDEEEYIDFLIEFWDYGFPVGNYVVGGVADFFTEEGEKVNYLLEGNIHFSVLE